MELDNTTNTEYLNNLCRMTDESEDLMRELKIKNTPLWKMIVLHRISINPAKALNVKYLDSDLVAYGLKYVSDLLYRNFDVMKQDEKNDLFITLTLLVMYGGFRTSTVPISVILPHYISLVLNMIEGNTLRPVLSMEIWGHYKTWLDNANIFYVEESRIRIEIDHLIKEQNKIKNIDL